MERKHTPTEHNVDTKTVLARINDPAPAVDECDDSSTSRDPHETKDDDTVLAHINGPAKTGATTDTTGGAD